MFTFGFGFGFGFGWGINSLAYYVMRRQEVEFVLCN